MKHFIILFLLLISVQNLWSQSISNTEFIWEKTNMCLSKSNGVEIFLKVETDPILSEFTLQEFKDFMKNLIEELKLEIDVSGFLKLKLLFVKNESLCLNEIGHKEIRLDTTQKEKLSNALNTIKKINYGKQRNKIVNCQGILYIDIKEGKMKDIRNVNFGLR